MIFFSDMDAPTAGGPTYTSAAHAAASTVTTIFVWGDPRDGASATIEVSSDGTKWLPHHKGVYNRAINVYTELGVQIRVVAEGLTATSKLTATTGVA